jgi:cellulase
MVYVAKASTKGEGAVWTKIFEEGLTNGKWAVEKFISNKGQITITLPDLADGDYLIRPEIIALHEGNREKGAQFYNGCGQISVSGGSAALPATGTDMTKAYSATDPGVLFNIYGGATSYPIPGPKVWDGASSGTTPATPATPTKSAAPVASAAPTKTAAPVSSPSPVAEKPSTPAAPSASAAPSTGNGGSALPETFTITQFISWLKQQTVTSLCKRFTSIDPALPGVTDTQNFMYD